MRTDTEHKTRMRLVALAAALIALAGFALAVGSAARAYVPKHGKACHRGYVAKHRTVKRHGHKRRMRVCVKRAPAATASRPVRLHAHLDPTYTRDPADPFRVTYQFSASATAEVDGAARASVAEAPAPLPSGVLSLFSDGVLYCAINVGGQAVGDDCPVQYQELGAHRVTTVYTSGEESATVTEVETIEPLPTTTSLTATFVPSPPHEVSIGVYSVGTLEAQTSGTLDGGPALGPVLARWESGWKVSVGDGPYESIPEMLTLHATTHPALGYTSSETSVTVLFTPPLPSRWEISRMKPPGAAWTLAFKTVYDKQTGVGTPLELKTDFTTTNTGCDVRQEAGDPLPEPESMGKQEQVAYFPDLPGGSVEVGIYVKSTEGNDCEVYGSLYASE